MQHPYEVGTGSLIRTLPPAPVLYASGVASTSPASGAVSASAGT